MSDYEFFCHACSRPFSKTLTPGEYEEGAVACPTLWKQGSRAGRLKIEKVQKQRNLRHSAITLRISFARHHFDSAICLILFSNHTACACSWQFAAVVHRSHNTATRATCGDESLTNRVSTLYPRCSATTLRLLLSGRAGLRAPGHD
jgi:hypothetical protein